MDTIITLNVSGEKFITKRKTLHECEPNYFTEELLDSLREALPRKNYFIDRDPTLFKYILNYLRGYSIPLHPGSPLESIHLQRQLLEEAEFYQITDLHQGLQKHIANHPTTNNKPPITTTDSPTTTTDSPITADFPEPPSNLSLWHQLENVRSAYEKAKKIKPNERDGYPTGFDPEMKLARQPTYEATEIQAQIDILERQIREWKIEDKIEETKQFLLTSVQYFQILSPQSQLTQTFAQQVEQFYSENQALFRQLATSNQNQQAPFELLNQMLNTIWSQGVQETPEGQSATTSTTPLDIMSLLFSKLNEQSESSPPSP